MSEIPNSIWNQDQNGDWKLYFNTECNISSSHTKNKEEKKPKNPLNISDKNLILGTLVMTPKGIGRLIKSTKETAHIRFHQESKEQQFPLNEILNYFNCYISYLSKGNIDIIRLKLKVDGKIADIEDELIKIKKINNKNIVLIYKKSLISKESTFEQINLCNNCKILVLEKGETEKKVSRFSRSKKHWYSYAQDGICFSPSENIQVTAFGLYCPHEDKKIIGVLKILEGASITGKVLKEENVELPPTLDNANCCFKVKLSKSFFCKKNMDYSLVFITNNITNTFSGMLGKNLVEGEKGVNFTFKRLAGNRGGTNVESGNFPDIYYY